MSSWWIAGGVLLVLAGLGVIAWLTQWIKKP